MEATASLAKEAESELVKALLAEFAELCRGEGYGNANPLEGLSKRDAERLKVVRSELLRRLGVPNT